MTLRARLVASFGYVVLLVLVVLAVPLALNVQERVATQSRARAAEAAYLVAAGTSGRLDRPDVLAPLVRDAAARVGGRVIVVDSGGILVADSAPNGLEGSDYRSRPEIQRALVEGRTTQGERRSDTLGRDLLVTAVPIVAAGQRVGAVRVTQSVASIDDRVRRDLLQVAALAGVGLIVGVVLVWVLAGALARPTRRLAGTADRLAHGDLGARARVEGAAEQRALAEGFNAMADRLQASLEAQRAFAGHASHQLRTPLTGLLLRIEGARDMSDDPDVDRELARAEDEVARLARLVDALLALAREGESIDLPVRPVDLRREAAAVVERFREQGARDGRAVALDALPGVVEVPLRPEDAAIALDNLVENALRYGSPGTPVTVVLRADGPDALVQVLDGGPGIDPEEAEAVFERFRRGSASLGTSGSGLGLALVRTLARRAGGDARVDPATRRVELLLPRVVPAGTAPSGPDPEAPFTSAEPARP